MAEEVKRAEVVQPSMKYAGFWIRFVAYLIDGLVLYIPSIGISFVFMFFGLASETAIGGTGGEIANGFIQLVSYGIRFVLGLLYFSLMESSKNQGTLGKMALGLKVVDYNGNRISFGKALGRYLSKLVSELILLIGYFMIGFTEKKQGLHDMMVNTYVVKK
jgi:uncharacterized RDD family membrane protein YckC